MTIGTGNAIVIASVWLMPSAGLLAKNVPSSAVWLTVGIATIITMIFA